MAKPDAMVGRHAERRTLDEMLRSDEAELLALYGRRRVGKTFLIRSHLEPRSATFFAVTGEKDGSREQQLLNFQTELERVFYAGSRLPSIRSWREGLGVLAEAVERVAAADRSGAITLFFDELPWLATPRSGLLQSLDYWWNHRLSRVPNLRVVLCGSAASWILDRLIHAKGGLHNRITRRIRLEPFDLSEARELLHSKGIRYDARQIVETYLVTGGVPYYLRQFERGRSAAENIALTCFHGSGVLVDEFEHLFAALFSRSEVHERIVRALATKRRGLSHDEIAAAKGLTSGGGLVRAIEELEAAGFVMRMPPYRARSKSTLFRLADPYSWFYLSWIERAPRKLLKSEDAALDYWLARARAPRYRAWAGYAFEGLCLDHVHQLKRALGFGAVPAEIATWRYVPRERSEIRTGAQVDLLFDREDGIIHLCEMKFAAEPFRITKTYARELREKVEIFQRVTKTKKEVVLTFVTVHGLEANEWSERLVERSVSIDAIL